MLDMSGARKKEACGEFNSFQLLVGQAGVKQLMGCEGGFPAQFRRARAFCAPADTTNWRQKLCTIAKAQVRLSCEYKCCVWRGWFNKMAHAHVLVNDSMSFL